jgi:hypothetical protein
MWSFCLRSLAREYGWRFAARIAVRHPLRTLKAFREASGLEATAASVEVGTDSAREPAGGPPSIVGAGFCLKPVNPLCPSGRANHDCRCLDDPAQWAPGGVAAPCRLCAIRATGSAALQAGSAFYVMTSAHDILDDVFVPALTRRTFRTGLFVLCRYSFKPFALGLLASGMSGRLLPLDQGDCRDYRTWLLADRGIKDEQATVHADGMASVSRSLGPPSPTLPPRVERRGNVLFPTMAGPVT